jgi:hypothetical protein
VGAGVKAADTSRDPSAVTSVIRHTIRAGSEIRYTVPFLGLPGVSNPLISAMIVGLLTYVIMPRYSRMVATRLYR